MLKIPKSQRHCPAFTSCIKEKEKGVQFLESKHRDDNSLMHSVMSNGAVRVFRDTARDFLSVCHLESEVIAGSLACPGCGSHVGIRVAAERAICSSASSRGFESDQYSSHCCENEQPERIVLLPFLHP